MVRFCFILILSSLIQSCFSSIYNKDKLFDYNLLTNQKSSLKENGFYYAESNIKNNSEFNNNPRSISVIILYPNGFLLNLGTYDGISNTYCSINKYYNEDSYSSAKTKFISYLEYLKSENRIYSSCKIKNNDVSGKGLYKIKNDSIFLQYYQAENRHKQVANNNYYLYELRGLIINSEEFIITEKIDQKENKVEKINLLYKFEANKNIPNLRNYFKK